MNSATDWKNICERLESLLPHCLDETPWNVLQQHSFALVANELLWRVEAIAEQVPRQGPIFLWSLARTEHAPATVFFGAIGLTREWQMKPSRKSPNYTTEWTDILTIP